MRFLLLIAAFLLNFNISASASTGSDAIIPMPIEQINSAMSMIQKRVRDASVRVMTSGGGHGSGSYIQYKDMYPHILSKHRQIHTHYNTHTPTQYANILQSHTA